jgi:hypothetical protein
MVKDLSRARLASTWCAVLIVIGAFSVVGGAAVTISSESWLVTCLVPPAVMLSVARRPPHTVAEVLYAVNRSSKRGRDRERGARSGCLCWIG